MEFFMLIVIGMDCSEKTFKKDHSNSSLCIKCECQVAWNACLAFTIYGLCYKVLEYHQGDDREAWLGFYLRCHLLGRIRSTSI